MVWKVGDYCWIDYRKDWRKFRSGKPVDLENILIPTECIAEIIDVIKNDIRVKHFPINRISFRWWYGATDLEPMSSFKDFVNEWLAIHP